MDPLEEKFEKLYRFSCQNGQSGPGSGSDLAKKFRIRIHNSFFETTGLWVQIQTSLKSGYVRLYKRVASTFPSKKCGKIPDVKITSVVVRHRFDADPDTDPTLYVDADPDTDPTLYVDADPDPDPD